MTSSECNDTRPGTHLQQHTFALAMLSGCKVSLYALACTWLGYQGRALKPQGSHLAVHAPGIHNTACALPLYACSAFACCSPQCVLDLPDDMLRYTNASTHVQVSTGNGLHPTAACS